MKFVRQKRALAVWVCLVTVIFFSLFACFFLTNDFWQDEVYTLHHFVFVPWRTVLTDYHSTNNHILFNVLLKGITGLMGVQTLHNAMEHPYWVRLVPFLFALLSVIVFYRKLQKHYGQTIALVGVSFLCTSIVFVDFAVQVRGYSLSILLTILLFFTLVRVVNRQKDNMGVTALFLLNALNLLCLPTNIYLSLSLLLLCFILICMPAAGLVFFNRAIQRRTFVGIAVSVAISTGFVLLYYQLLLQRQPENPLIHSFKLVNIRNAVQALAVFYHFTDYKFYVFAFLFFWTVAFLKKGGNYYSKLVLPAFFFFAPFLFFFIHGAIIIQRTFLPLLPFFVMIVAAAVTELTILKRIKNVVVWVCFANLIVLVIASWQLRTSSKQANRLSVHEHDLRNHYYLVNFNAKNASLLARRYTTTRPVLLWDDFGGTGISYYLETYKVPFVEYNKPADLEAATLLLTNNKAKAEKELKERRIAFKKLLNDEGQYTIYFLESAR